MYIKARYTWNKVDKRKKIFFLNQLTFLFQTDLKKFPTVENGLGKRTNLYLIKLVSKWKRAIRIGHTSFLLFYFWDLKSIDLALNSVSGNYLIFFKNGGIVPRNAAKLENPAYFFRFWLSSGKNGWSKLD